MLKSLLINYNPIYYLFDKVSINIPIFADLFQYARKLLFDKDDQILQKILFLIGISAITFKTVKSIYTFSKTWKWVPEYIYAASQLSFARLKTTYGNCYVLITGFTDGIGYAYAQIFAEAGFNLLLVSRNKQKCDLKMKQLKQNYPSITIHTIVSNLSDSKDLQELERSFNMYSDLDVGIVINNAGSVASGPFLTLKPQDIYDDLMVDINALFEVNRIFVPKLRARQGRSAIINLSSCTGFYLAPRVGVYSSGKKTVDIYSRILAEENKDKIDVMSLRPFGVTTKMMRMKKGPMMLNPRECVISSLSELQYGQTATFGHWKHQASSSLGFVNLRERERLQLYNKLWDDAKLKTS